MLKMLRSVVKNNHFLFIISLLSHYIVIDLSLVIAVNLFLCLNLLIKLSSYKYFMVEFHKFLGTIIHTTPTLSSATSNICCLKRV